MMLLKMAEDTENLVPKARLRQEGLYLLKYVQEHGNTYSLPRNLLIQFWNQGTDVHRRNKTNLLTMNTLKIAYIGMGYRGKQLLALTRHIPYFQVTAIADPEAREADYDVPCYNQGGDDYQRMITLHAPQLVSLLLHGSCT